MSKTVLLILAAFVAATFLIKRFALAKTEGIPPALIDTIISAESSWRADAEGPMGERGLFQFKKETWIWITEKMYGHSLDFDLAYNADINKEVGLYYLKWLKEQLGDRYTPVLLTGAFHYGFGRIRSLGYRLPSEAYYHPNLIYRNLFRKGI